METRPARNHKRFLGGYAEGVTPVPIPNTEVKPLRADGTARVAVWESRSPPGIKSKQPLFLNRNRGSRLWPLTRDIYIESLQLSIFFVILYLVL